MSSQPNHPLAPHIYGEFTSQAQIDAEYNPSANLTDHDAPMNHYLAQAQKARSTLHCELDVPYGPTRAETLDIFLADKPDAPVFIFVHGGYWRSLSSKEFSGVALGMHPQGVTTVVVNYALAPFVSIDEITRQVRASVAWVLKNIWRYGGDASRVAIAGHSAGGHLAAMSLLTHWEAEYALPQDPFCAAILVSGLYDLAPLRYSYLQPMIQLDDGIIRRQSPVLHTRPSKTPIWVTWGDQESSEFARQSCMFHDGWTDCENTSTLSPVANADHFSAIHGFENPHSPMTQWLVDHLKNRKN